MDGIQPYDAVPPQPLLAHPMAVGAAPPKGSSDYFRALRRRVWLVLAVGLSLSVALAILIVRMPAVYRATAEIQIEPPVIDPQLTALVSRDFGPRDKDATERYVPNRIAQLQSKSLAEEVVQHPDFAPGAPASAAADPAQELLNNLQSRRYLTTNYFTVTLEGTDPERAQRQLNLLLETFAGRAKAETYNTSDDTEKYATQSLQALENELKDLDREIVELLAKSATIAPGGKNVLVDQVERADLLLMQKKARLHEFQNQAYLSQVFPNLKGRLDGSPRDGQLAELDNIRQRLTGQMNKHKRLIRRENFNTDPAIQNLAGQLDEVLGEMKRLRSAPSEAGPDPNDVIVRTMQEEIHRDEEMIQDLQKRAKLSVPEHQRYLMALEARQQLIARINKTKESISNYQILSKTQKDPIRILQRAAEPTIPVRPARIRYMAIAIVLSFGLAIGLVCLLEYLDHSVKVPEHLAYGLTLPLLGVVPRMRRTARLDRGGHLWTPGAPESVEADAYRNLRASLLGVSVKRGPIVTLLVASAKAGEGKSTTALNLAATCARAGERTLLMDVDLRRPSLAEVFREDDHDVGLVDVLRGELPWQRTVIRTDIANLDFLPTGDTRDIPIEILGTLELRQLLIALSHHYDRVILDGPAVLGLADCRMLGRVVDAAILVVRSGLHELRPLQRAKAMLEQSHVAIAGVVFNALFEDLKNWSCYGPNTPSLAGGGPPKGLGMASDPGPDPYEDVRAALTSASNIPH